MTKLSDAKVTRRNVYIGDVCLPNFIEVFVKPGGHKSVNRVTVTFLVGRVEVTDDES